MNISDSERIRSVLETMGYERTDVEEEADLLGVVSCSVRQKAIDKVYTRIHKWNQFKRERSVLTFVSGCVLPTDREKFVDRFDLMFTINELPQLPDMIRQHGLVTPATVGADTRRDFTTDFWRITPQYSSRFEAYIPIQNGCDKFCTFCAVPYTRGREVSRSSKEILGEVRHLVDQGYRSLTLLGQNVNSYGMDRHGSEIPFRELLTEIGEIGRASGRRFWVYFTSPHPHDMTDEVIDVIAEYPWLAKQIHLPIQSGDDEVLIKMNRNYGVSQYRKIIEKIRATIPDATIFTDIMVGFSGETEEQFEHTRAAMREFRFAMAYVAMYSPRPGAASSRWEDDVPHQEKRRRLHELSAELQQISGEMNRGMVGKRTTILVDGHDRKEGFLSGKTEGRVIVRFASGDPSLLGEFVTVEITSGVALSLQGEFVQIEQ